MFQKKTSNLLGVFYLSEYSKLILQKMQKQKL